MVQYRSDNKTMYSTVQSPTAHAGFVSVSVSVSGLRLHLHLFHYFTVVPVSQLPHGVTTVTLAMFTPR